MYYALITTENTLTEMQEFPGDRENWQICQQLVIDFEKSGNNVHFSFNSDIIGDISLITS